MLATKLKAIDLFCGCDGISVGMQKAGYEVLAGIDIEKKCLAGFKHNFSNAKSLHVDITSIRPEEVMNTVSIVSGELDLLAGGPPCQGFSKNVPRKFRYLEDPKNLLVKSFLEYCETLQPKIVLIENVAEMKNGFAKAYSLEIVNRLQEGGYTVTTAVLNSADYGVPQRRRRAFFMGNRYGIKFSTPTPTHAPIENSGNNAIDLFVRPAHISVWDAIGDLPNVEHGKGLELTPYLTHPQTEYQKIMRGSKQEVNNHIETFARITETSAEWQMTIF